MENKIVITKWGTEGELAVIYRLENIMLFYITENDPHWKQGQEVSLNEVGISSYYKCLDYEPENIPSDAYDILGY